MSLERVLENWTEYDNRKVRDGRDGKFFACTETWEVDYLIRKIRAVFPSHSETSVRNAISQCCQQLKAPHPRREFVVCVLRRLGLYV